MLAPPAALAPTPPTQTTKPLSCCSQGGWNPAALSALLLGVAPCLPGLLHAVTGSTAPLQPAFQNIYDLGWFVGVAISCVVYTLMMRGQGQQGAAGAGGVSGGPQAPPPTLA